MLSAEHSSLEEDLCDLRDFSLSFKLEGNTRKDKDHKKITTGQELMTLSVESTYLAIQ